MLFWVWILAILIALLLYFRQLPSRFRKYGVKYVTPVPFFGNALEVALRLEHFTDFFLRNYTNFPNERFVGRFEFTTPIVTIRDLELVKKITVKDFEHFLDRRIRFETFFDKNILALRDNMRTNFDMIFKLAGQDWKEMRSSLSPAFTSSKMRLMVPFMVEVGEQMIRYLKTKMLNSGMDYIDINVLDLTTRYANDVIATCAFGLKVNSHKEENNQFYTMARKNLSFSLTQLLLVLFSASFPKIAKKLNASMLSEETKSFYNNLVLETMKERETSNIIRPDMIHLLLAAKKGKLTHEDKSIKDANAGFASVEESAIGKNEIKRVWTDDELVAQAMIFLLGGFDTISSTMAFLLHELAINPDVQEKLYQEIKETDAKNMGKFDFNSIQQMEYMDMVVSEVLRLWPPAPFLDRICIKDYNLGKPNETATEDYIVREGEGIEIPLWGIHHNPEYYPDPFKFIPERFSEENKRNIKPFSYMPFGLGPRNCIGSRFALCEVKVMAYQLLQSMEVCANSKTQKGNDLSKEFFNIVLKNGHWVRLRARN